MTPLCFGRREGKNANMKGREEEGEVIGKSRRREQTQENGKKERREERKKEVEEWEKDR